MPVALNPITARLHFPDSPLPVLPGGSSRPGVGLDSLFRDGFEPAPTTASVGATTAAELSKQRQQLKALSDFLKADAFVHEGPLRGFSHAYHNTIEGHLKQLDNAEFEDPAVINAFAIDFANRYRRNIEALRARDAGDFSARPDAHWDYAWNRGGQLDYVPFLPEYMIESGQILLGKTAHIDYDLKLALSEALQYKINRDGLAASPPRSLEKDFLTAEAHFETTTDQTAEEMGIPDLIAGIGSTVSDVPAHRRERFEEWVRASS